MLELITGGARHDRCHAGDERSTQRPPPTRLSDLFTGIPVRFRPGSHIYTQGTPLTDVCLLQRGWAFLYQMSADGRRQILDLVMPGDLVNLQLARMSASFEGAQTLTNAAVCSLPRQRFVAALHSFPWLADEVHAFEERRGLRAFDHLTRMGRRSARERLAGFLLEAFCRVHGRLPRAFGDSALLPLRQEVVGDAIGLTAIHVSRVLRDLRRDEILEMRLGVLRILDPKRLIQLVGPPEVPLWIPACDGLDPGRPTVRARQR